LLTNPRCCCCCCCFYCLFCDAAEEDIVVSEVEAPQPVAEEQIVEIGDETPAEKQ
jgi:hypothetical protein